MLVTVVCQDQYPYLEAGYFMNFVLSVVRDKHSVQETCNLELLRELLQILYEIEIFSEDLTRVRM